MKVFIRTSEVAGESPTVVASYSDESNVSAKAHGDNVTMLTIPSHLMISDADSGMMPPPIKLKMGWREQAWPMLLQAEATRRINDVVPPEEQVLAMHEIVESLIQHGLDVSQWPEDAKNRKAECDKKLNYVRQVREQARSGVSQADPTSDKGWPTRVK